MSPNGKTSCRRLRLVTQSTFQADVGRHWTREHAPTAIEVVGDRQTVPSITNRGNLPSWVRCQRVGRTSGSPVQIGTCFDRLYSKVTRMEEVFVN